MKKYIIVLMISMFFLAGCENKGSSVTDDNQPTDISPTPNPTPSPTPFSNPNLIPIQTPTENPDLDPVPIPDIGLIDKRESIEQIAKEWYVRIVVEDTTNNMKTSDTQLGRLDAIDAVEKHTLKAIAPFGSNYLDVVFVNPIGVDAGSYKSNFHVFGNDEDSWEFTVKSYDNNATMILSWRGLYVLTPYTDSENRERYREYRSMTNPLLSYMTLLDVSTNTEIDVLVNGTMNEYVFDMNGSTERVFRWTVKDSSLWTSSEAKTLKHMIKPSTKLHTERLKELQIKALRKDAKARPDTLKSKRLDSFDMMIPPTFEVLVK